MARLTWGKPLDRVYSAGISHGVVYGQDKSMYAAWNGLTNVEFATQAGEYEEYYLDGYKYHHAVDGNEYGARITALTYPDAFEQFIGSDGDNGGLMFNNQHHRQFHMTYRTERLTSVEGQPIGYELHVIYNALVLPTSGGHTTYKDVVQPDEMSWDIRTKPIRVAGRAPTASMTIRSWEADPVKLKTLEDILYGTNGHAPRMISLNDLIELFDAWPTAEIVRNSRYGLSALLYKARPDLQGNNVTGLYKAPVGSRLTPTAKAGLYTLEGR